MDAKHLPFIELAFQWLVAQPHIDSVIIGARTPEHLQSNLEAMKGRLDQDTLRACDEVWQTLRGAHFRYYR